MRSLRPVRAASADSIAGTRKKGEKMVKDGKRRETKETERNLGERKEISDKEYNASNLSNLIGFI